MTKDYVVLVVTTDDMETTGVFGPMTESEADAWCDRFNSMQEEIGKTEGYELQIVQLTDPNDLSKY